MLPPSDTLEPRGSTVATRAETIYHHTCDLCGREWNEDELAHLWGPHVKAGQRPQIDICPECQRKPVAAALAWLDREGDSTKPRSFKPARQQPSATARSRSPGKTT
jgi:hypothetical protein